MLFKSNVEMFGVIDLVPCNSIFFNLIAPLKLTLVRFSHSLACKVSNPTKLLIFKLTKGFVLILSDDKSWTPTSVKVVILQALAVILKRLGALEISTELRLVLFWVVIDSRLDALITVSLLRFSLFWTWSFLSASRFSNPSIVVKLSLLVMVIFVALDVPDTLTLVSSEQLVIDILVISPLLDKLTVDLSLWLVRVYF